MFVHIILFTFSNVIAGSSLGFIGFFFLQAGTAMLLLLAHILLGSIVGAPHFVLPSFAHFHAEHTLSLPLNCHFSSLCLSLSL